MIFSFWQEHLDEFLESMYEQGFCPIVIATHKRFALSLEEQSQDNGWHSYEDVRNYYRNLPDMKDKTRWFKLSIISKLEAFHIFGKKPVHRVVKNHSPVSEPTCSMGNLDLFPMRENIDGFLEFFIQQELCDSIVLSIRRTVNRIIMLSASNPWDTYQDIKDWYSGNGLTAKYLDKIHRIIDLMEYWQLNGTLVGWDDQGVVITRKRRFLTISIDKMEAVPSLGDFDLSYVQNHMDEFLDCMKDKGYSESSVATTRNDLKRIVMLSRSIRWDSIKEIADWNDHRPISKDYKNHIRSTLEKFSCWLSTGDLPEHPSVQKKLESRIHSLGNLDLAG